jgi:hypothetical protein
MIARKHSRLSAALKSSSEEPSLSIASGEQKKRPIRLTPRRYRSTQKSGHALRSDIRVVVLSSGRARTKWMWTRHSSVLFAPINSWIDSNKQSLGQDWLVNLSLASSDSSNNKKEGMSGDDGSSSYTNAVVIVTFFLSIICVYFMQMFCSIRFALFFRLAKGFSSQSFNFLR